MTEESCVSLDPSELRCPDRSAAQRQQRSEKSPFVFGDTASNVCREFVSRLSLLRVKEGIPIPEQPFRIPLPSSLPVCYRLGGLKIGIGELRGKLFGFSQDSDSISMQHATAHRSKLCCQ